MTSLQRTDEKRRCGRSDDVAELWCTKEIGILPGPKKKRSYRRTVITAEIVVISWLSSQLESALFERTYVEGANLAVML